MMKMKKPNRAIKKLRKEKDLPQKGMAALLGVSRNTIAAIESGTKALSQRLAKAAESMTGVPAEWLLANDVSKPMPVVSQKIAEKSYRDGIRDQVTELFESPAASRLYENADDLYKRDSEDLQYFIEKENVCGLNGLWFKFQMLRLIAAGESASKKGNCLIFNFKMDKMIRDFESSFESRQQANSRLATVIRCLATRYRGPRKFTI
jgi:transcriptional regulator with XRE-family HTH domain